jgi:hypothetical protein
MNEVRLKGQLEMLWWGFTLVVAVGVLLPIWLQTHHFPFYIENLIFIVIAITFTRYAFLLRHTFIARMLWPKLFILAISAILIFVLIMALGDFTNFLDEKGLQLLVDHQPVHKQYRVIKYIQGEMIFFGVASVFSAFFLSLRMLISIWRMRNRGTV